MLIKTGKLILAVILLFAVLGACSESGKPVGNAKPATTPMQERVASDRADEINAQERNGLQDYGNNPPEITDAKLIADLDQEGLILHARVVAVDKEDDEISLEYRWEKNGLTQEEQGDTIRDFKRGDKIVLTVRPFDRYSSGKSVSIGTEIANTAPLIETDDEFSVDGSMFTKKIGAKDADGDTLVYELEKGPEGMKIDSSSGMLSWTIPPDIVGNFSARIIVSDGHGGRVSYDIEIPITIEEENKKR